jgi:hypothetical protein
LIIHSKSFFDLLSVELQSKLVRLIGLAVKRDPNEEWCEWPLKVHFACCFGTYSQEFIGKGKVFGKPVLF